MLSSSLQRALRRGLAPGGDLHEEISRLGKYPIKSKKDARAIVEALSRFPSAEWPEDGYSSPLESLLGLLQDVEGTNVPAFDILYDEGTPELIRLFRALLAERSENDKWRDELLFILKLLAMYGSLEGADVIVEAARMPLHPDAYMWSPILRIVGDEHPQRDYVYRQLADPLPEKFVAVALLDSATNSAIESGLARHPFDSEAGVEQIRKWLASTDSSEFSYAQSAAATLPFITRKERDELLGLAREHAAANVRMEAAWASAKVGLPIGVLMLVQFCLDPNHAATASTYLEELGRAHLIPDIAADADFQAQAEFSRWLAHPNELGQPPDELKIVDKRTIYWPPAEKEIPLWGIQYRLRDPYRLAGDDVNCGLVGNVTWCFFSKFHLPPEDMLAIHCVWELGLHAHTVDDSEEYATLLQRWPGPTITDAKVTHVLELPHKLNLGTGFVCGASGSVDGRAGWAVVDGEHSQWYDKAEFVDDFDADYVIDMHVGRRLLGFNQQPDRRAWHPASSSKPSSAELVERFEELLEECRTADASRREELLMNYDSPLQRHLEPYVQACAEVRQQSRSQAMAHAIEKILDIVGVLDPESLAEFCRGTSPFWSHFDAYAEGLEELGELHRLRRFIQRLAPVWDDFFGEITLGKAALKLGELAMAEEFLEKARSAHPNTYRTEAIELLAEVWHRRGNEEQAKKLLVDSLQKLLADAKEATGSDIKSYEEKYQAKRACLLRLFPEGEKYLREHNLPSGTLAP